MSQVPAGQAEVAGPVGMSRRSFAWLMVAMMLALMLGALDQTVVVTAMRTIADQLHGLPEQAWVTTAYLITTAVSTTMYGRLSDIYGRKLLYALTIVIFMVGSALSMSAQSIWELAGFRALQGIGAGGLMSLPTIILSDLVSPRERGRYTGYTFSVFGVASVIGPLIGGALVSQRSILGIAGWRWIFLLNVPLSLAALAIVLGVLKLPYRRVPRRVDYWGALTLLIGVVAILVVAEQGSDWGWTSAASAACYAVAAVGLAAFVFVESKMGRDGLIPLRLFRIGVFSISNTLTFVVGFASFGGFVLPTLYMQIVLGKSPTVAGLIAVPWMLATVFSAILTGRLIVKFGKYKAVSIVGLGLSTVAVYLFALVGVSTPLTYIVLVMALMGFGFGMCLQPLVLAVQNVVPPQEIGVATASTRFFQQMGGTLGTSALLAVTTGLFAEKAADAYRSAETSASFTRLLTDPAVLANASNRTVADALVHGGVKSLNLNDTALLAQLNPQLGRPMEVGFANAMDVALLICGGLMTVAFVLAFWLKEVPLSRMAGMQRRAAAETKEAATKEAATKDAAAGAGEARAQSPAAPGSAG